MKLPAVALCLSLMLAACTSHPAATVANPAPPATATTNALAGTPLSAYGTALNKAKNVQNIVDEQARKQAEAIEKATGGGH